MRVNSGADLQAIAMAGSSPGFTGTATGTTASTLTMTGAGWTTNQWAGFIVSLAGAYMVVLSNSATVLTGDQWYAPATPGGAATGTPAAGVFTIAGASPVLFMALTANVGAPSATDTALTGEITTGAGTLKRKIATYAHTLGTAAYTETATFAANASDAVPVTVHKAGMFNSVVPATGIMWSEDVLSPADAQYNASGDTATLTLTANI